MFTDILLEETIFPEYKLPDNKQWLDNLNRINILIGSNNSGKSRFIRRLFSSNKLHFSSKVFNSKEYQLLVDQTKERFNELGYSQNETVKKLILMIPSFYSFNNNKNFSKELSNLEMQISANYNLYNISNNNKLKDLTDYINKYKGIASNNSLNYESLYIPILRGTVPIQIKDLPIKNFAYDVNNYLERCIKDYPGFSSIDKEKIFTGLDLYERTQSLLLGDSKDREKIRKFEEFLSESFFQNQVVNIVPRKNHDVLHVKIGNSEHPIYDLGDGIQSVIILTYPLFFSDDKPTVFFIEEPETHLHPGLQRVFIDTLLRPEFSKFQYFLTTHSNHFLDITLDYNNISVYTFSKDHNSQENLFHINNVSSGDSNTLELLGVRNSSVFLSNCTIWVEGITDRLDLRKYLQLYQDNLGRNKYKEDYHFSFVEYGGNNITHWSFLDSVDENEPNINVDALCGRLFLITDKDNAGLKKNGEPNSSSSRKQLRHQALKAKLGERYHCIESREIENILSKDVVKKVILSYVDNVNIDFSKFDKGNYANEYLGTYIDSKIENLGRSFESRSGTINDKVNFCRKAIVHLNSFDDMTQEAKELVEKIYNFIESNNV